MQLIIVGIIFFVYIAYCVYLHYTWSSDNSPNNHLLVIRNLYIINTLFLLSSCYMHYIGIPYYPLQDKGLLLWIHNILMIPCFVILLLRMFFISNIYSIVLTIFYIRFLMKTRFPKSETILFIILLLLSILGFVCLELEMNAAWHAWSGV